MVVAYCCRLAAGLRCLPQDGSLRDVQSLAGHASLGPVRYDKPMACQTNAFARNEILVGMDFLKHFNYVVDYSRGIVVLRTRKNP